MHKDREDLQNSCWLSRLVDQAGDGIAAVGLNCKVSFANPAWARMHGYAPEEIPGRHLSLFHSEEQMRREVAPLLAEALRGDGHSAQVGHARKDGTSFPTWMTVSVLRSKTGRAVGFAAFATDITEHSRSEAALEQSEHRYRTLVENVPVGLWEVDAAGRHTFVSPNVERLSGYTQEEIYEGFWNKVIHPEDAGWVREAGARLFAEGRPYEVEYRVRRKDGSLLWVFDKAVATFERGGTRYAQGVFMDITERKRTEEELERSRRHIGEMALREKQRANWLSTILDHLPAGVLIVAPDGSVVLVNQTFRDLWGVPMVDLKDYGSAWQVLRADGAPLPPGELIMLRALRGEHSIAQEYIWVRPDGRHVPVIGSALPLKDNGGVTGAVGVFSDISAQKELQRGIEEASRQKDEFFSLASHELKVPVTSIKLLCDLATRHPDRLPPRMIELLTRQAGALVRLVDDLLDVSRLQMGRLPLKMAPLDMANFLRDLCERGHAIYQKHHLTCAMPEVPAVVSGDPVRLDQVFLNLLDNAAKYSPEGTVIAVASVVREGRVRVSVSDQGIGIPPEHLPHVFERFYKPAQKRGLAAYPGLGIGLYVSREVVDGHGGLIWAESKVGEGSTFHVELPLAETWRPPAHPSPWREFD
ncbi:MAG: PAS domain S-box protein [Pseudomonadota bacterium]